MDGQGNLLDAGELGEVVIRGRNVTAGYENNAKANAENFVNGWFRTGDQGIIDQQGYLRLTGRLKELINRGGEKVSPLEIDAVLMDHPAVAQCLAFALPHDKLGEEVAAAIVLREGVAATDHELREFAGLRLAAFKVPRKIVFLDEIPKGATGKLMRIGLAEKLGLA
jgi:acyl-CoA synthetase (AMP-forming)/AMP-acid ligase II